MGHDRCPSRMIKLIGYTSSKTILHVILYFFNQATGDRGDLSPFSLVKRALSPVWCTGVQWTSCFLFFYCHLNVSLCFLPAVVHTAGVYLCEPSLKRIDVIGKSGANFPMLLAL